MLIATEEPPPPPPNKVRRRKPERRPVECRGRLPLFRRRDLKVRLDEETVVGISLLWMSRPRWTRSAESNADSGWHPCAFGFIVIAVRVEW